KRFIVFFTMLKRGNKKFKYKAIVRLY
ncbi:uncharacterized protein METZ01_LOCUS364945, partial [marine metagenome]